ncbi:MAG: HAD family phosphatase [Acidobacteriota bacterium]|nr:HAD family phosphatase [Blastocatellia bacterium]MDW8413478.1 HAD family phosphatase [Acidobacteriota bacterium]
MSKLIIFDLMDTIVVDPFSKLFPSLCGMTMRQLLEVKDPESWILFELGEITEDEYFERFYRRETNLRLDNTRWFKERIFASYEFVEGMERLLEELKRSNYQLWVHSNYPVWFEVVRDRLGLDRFFKGYVLSYEIRARKPDCTAYKRALGRINALPRECTFIDDREANVEAARRFGLSAILFRDVSTLVEDLRLAL